MKSPTKLTDLTLVLILIGYISINGFSQNFSSEKIWEEKKYAFISTNADKADENIWVETALGIRDAYIEGAALKPVESLLKNALGKAFAGSVGLLINIIDEATPAGGDLEAQNDFQLIYDGSWVDYSYGPVPEGYTNAFRLAEGQSFVFLGYSLPAGDKQSYYPKLYGYPTKLVIEKLISYDLRKGKQIYETIQVYDDYEVKEEKGPYLTLYKEKISLPKGFYQLKWGNSKKFLYISQAVESNSGSYPATVKFTKTYNSGQPTATIFYMNENKVEFKFTEDDEFMFFFNYYMVDLKNHVQHGLDSDNLNFLFHAGDTYDYSDQQVILNSNIRLKVKLVKINSKTSRDIEYELTILSKPKELIQVEAKFDKFSRGDMLHCLFKTKSTNKELDFYPKTGDTQFIIAHENLLKNNYAVINYILVEQDIAPMLGWSDPEIAKLPQITSIKINNLYLSDWWVEISKDAVKMGKYKKMASDYLNALKDFD